MQKLLTFFCQNILALLVLYELEDLINLQLMALLTLLLSEGPKLYGVLAFLSAIGLS